jgi:TRAP-type C4-dicarboxylate transport system permease small subunit
MQLCFFHSKWTIRQAFIFVEKVRTAVLCLWVVVTIPAAGKTDLHIAQEVFYSAYKAQMPKMVSELVNLCCLTSGGGGRITPRERLR